MEKPEDINDTIFDEVKREIELLLSNTLKHFHEHVKNDHDHNLLEKYLGSPMEELLKDVEYDELTYIPFGSGVTFTSFVPLFKLLNWEKLEKSTKLLIVQHYFSDFFFQLELDQFLIFSKSAYSSIEEQGSPDYFFYRCGFGKNQEGESSIVCHNYTAPSFSEDGDDVVVKFWFLLLEDKTQDMIGQCKIVISKDLKVTSSVDNKSIWTIKRRDRKRTSIQQLIQKDPIKLRIEFYTSGVESFFEEELHPLPKLINYIPVNKLDFMAYDVTPLLLKLNWTKMNADQKMSVAQHFFNDYIFKRKCGLNLIFHEQKYANWKLSFNTQPGIEYYFHLAGFGKTHKKGEKKICQSYTPPKFVESNENITVFYWGFLNDPDSYTVAKCKATIGKDETFSIEILQDFSWVIKKHPDFLTYSKTSDPSVLLKEYLQSPKVSHFIKAYLPEHDFVNYVPHQLSEGFLNIDCCSIFKMLDWSKLSKETKLEVTKHFFNNYIFLENRDVTKMIFFTKNSYSSLNGLVVYSVDYYFENAGFGKPQESLNKNETTQKYTPPSFVLEEDDNSVIVQFWTFTISSSSNIVAKVRCKITNDCKLKVTIDNDSIWIVRSRIVKLFDSFSKKKVVDNEGFEKRKSSNTPDNQMVYKRISFIK